MRWCAQAVVVLACWAVCAGRVAAQPDPAGEPAAAPAEAATDGRGWFNFSFPSAKPDRAAGPGLFGEGVPPAVLLLDMSLPPGLNGAVPLGESALWAPTVNVLSQPAYFGMVRQDASGGVPLYSADREALIGYVDVRNTLFHTDAFLTDSARPFPKQLWDIGSGLLYSRSYGGGWTVGGTVSVSSPSDQPFSSTRQVYPSFTGFVRMPASQTPDGWLMSLSWIPVSLIRFPLPGIAYEWNPSKELQVVAGVPFSITWRPRSDVRFDLGYMPPFQARAQLTWAFLDNIQAFIGFTSVTDAYLLEDRIQRRDFFYNYEKRLPAGVRFMLSEHCVLDVAGGYLFDRLYFSSTNFTDERRDRVHVAPAAFGMVRFALVY